MDPVVIEHLRRGHPLYRHIGDFLTRPSNAAAEQTAALIREAGKTAL